MINTNSYQAKQFNLSGLNGISDRTLEMHFAFFRATEASFGSYDIWKADFVGIGKMRGVGF